MTSNKFDASGLYVGPRHPDNPPGWNAFAGEPDAPRSTFAQAATEYHSENFSRRKSFTAAELQAQEFDPLIYVADQVLVPGSTILGGRPKVNKSWWALELVKAKALGGVAFGALAAPMGDVLYYACEDNARRLQGRLRKIQPDGGWPHNLTFRTVTRKLFDGFKEDVAQWCAENERPALVVVDTYHFIRPPRAKMSYDTDYADSAEVTRTADALGVAILCVHHQRKAGGDDGIDTISGTTGVAAGFDSILTLERDPAGGFNLEGRGRDLPDFRYALNFDKETCRWSFLGDSETARLGDTRKRLLDLLDTGTFGPKHAANATGLDVELVKKTLQRMYDDGQIQKTGRGEYAGANPTVF